MIRYSLPSSFRARLGAACTVALLGLAILPSARATSTPFEPGTVAAGDTFSIEAVGFNTANPANDIYIFATNLNPTFGTTTGYANDALAGQTLTVSSSEFTSNGTTTDFISVSVPSNFVPAGTTDNGGQPLNAIQFSFGNYLGGTNPLDFSLALTTYNVATAATFNFNGTTTSVPGGSTSTLSNGGKSLSAFGQVMATAPTTDISNNDVTALSFTITYAAVPEPTTTGAVLLGAGSLLGLAIYRRRSVRA